MKKLFCILICVCALVAFCVVSASAETLSGACGDGVTYTLDTDTGVLTISGSGAMWDFSSAPWCEDLSLVKEVVIENGVTKIGANAFKYCNFITGITIPSSVTEFGKNAFYIDRGAIYVDYLGDAVGWLNIKFDYSDVTSYPLVYGDSMYFNGKLVREIEIPNGVTSLRPLAFAGFTHLESIMIPDSVTEIGWHAFTYCLSLESITIPSGVISVNGEVFYGCENLNYIDVEKDNQNYTSVDGVLFNKDKTTLVQYPMGKSEASYSIPDSVIEIGTYAFYYCDVLTTVTVPDSVNEIGTFAFANCYNLTSINIPNGITTISDSSFGGCDGLTSITIPDSVTVIEDTAFFGCSGLTSIIIPEGVTSIGMNAFTFCDNLESVFMPRSVTDIDKIAFANCEKLTLYCYKDSYAESYAKKYGYPYEYILIDGDLNIDYALDISDVLLMIGAVLDGDTYKNADMNGDGLTTLLDVFCLLKTII